MPTPSPATSRRSCARRFRSSASCRASTLAPTRSSATTCRGPAATAWSTATARCCRQPVALRNQSQRQGILGAVAHEFFHAWNMERIRSRAIEPFDYENANVSSDLWFGEGVTSYFDDLIVHRAGLQSLDDLLDSYAGLINAVDSGPGPAHPLGRGDEPACPVRRRRRVDRPHGVEQHLHLLLHVGRHARHRARPVAARHDGRQGRDGRLHAADVDVLRRAWE